MTSDPQPQSESEQRNLRWGLRTALNQLDESSRRRLGLATLALALVSSLDFLGVTMLASVGVVVVSLVYPESSPSGFLGDLVDRVGDSPTSIAMVGAIAVGALILKSILSWLIYRRVLLFLAKEQAQIARSLFTRYMQAPMALTMPMGLGAVVNAIIVGARASAQLLLSLCTLVADLVLVIGLTALLAIASPSLLAFSIVYFGGIAVLLSRLVGRRNHAAAAIFAAADVSLASSVIQACGLSREVRVYGTLEGSANDVEHHQGEAAQAQAHMMAWMQVPRYSLEVALIVGIAGATTIVLLTQTPDQAAFSLGLFTVAASRLIPAVQRVNGSWAQSQASLGQMTLAKPLLALPATDASGSYLVEGTDRSAVPTPGHSTVLLETDTVNGFNDQSSDVNALVLDSVGFRYPGSDVDALTDFSLKIEMPQRVALVGPSGSGKSTLADILLGLLAPTRGSIYLEGPEGRKNVSVAFVAQEVFLSNGDVRSNVTLHPQTTFDYDDDVWRALETAQLTDVVRALPEGLDTQLGERGVRLSGGQRQRLGLARALYRRPDLLILDEATSALDAETERLVTEAINKASESITIVAVAHRLATVRDAHTVCYLDAGRLKDVGTFDELVNRHEDLAAAAKLQGLG